MELTSSLSGVRLDIESLSNKNIIKRLVEYGNLHYYTFCYDKDVLCYNDNETRLYRMVIVSYPENQLLSYLPPKSMGYNTFISIYPTITTNIQISEYIKGTMINLMYDDRCNEWRVASPSDEKTTNIISKFKTALHINDQNTTPILEYLSKTQTYTFVLKKNYNKVTQNTDKFYLISVYEMQNNTIKYIPNTDYENNSFLRDIEGIIYFPRKYNLDSYNDIHDIPDDIDGYLITDLNTGHSTRIMNPDTIIRETISDINPYYAYEYFCVRRIGKLYEYNRIYRKTRDIRHKIHGEYEKLITILHQHYMHKFIFKTKSILPDKYIQHVNFLHTNVYIPSLKKKNKEKITRSRVKEYLHLLNPSELLNLLYQ